MNPWTVALLSPSLNTLKKGFYPALRPSQTSINSLFWVQVYKSSDWPEILTSKDYFVLYSTDHNSGAGGIFWGEFDNLNGLTFNGFVELGKIIDGYSHETPWLLRVPPGESAVTDDPIFLYYHTGPSDPLNADTYSTLTQETHVMTTTGGALHSATWIYRGKPLGLVTGEVHTGYFPPIRRGVNDYIGDHLGDGSGTGGKVSVSSDPATGWTRLVTYTGSEGMPTGGKFHRTTIQEFYRNGVLYGIFRYMPPNNASWEIALAKLDGTTYLPTEFIKTLAVYPARDLTSYIEGDNMYLITKEGDTSPDYNAYYIFLFSLRNLD